MQRALLSASIRCSVDLIGRGIPSLDVSDNRQMADRLSSSVTRSQRGGSPTNRTPSAASPLRCAAVYAVQWPQADELTTD
jgi:hypothetical protein